MANDRKLRVLHVLKSSIYSGAENVAITIIKQLNNRFEFIYVATDGPIREKLEEEKIPHILLNSFNRGNLRCIIQRLKPDIIHAHDFSATVFCASLTGGFRLISHLHCSPLWAQKWNMRTVLYRMAAHRAFRILAVSEKAYDSFAFAECLRNKCMIIGNPLDAALVRKMSKQESAYQCDLIFVGRLSQEKNPQRFLKIVRMLQENGMNAAGIILGDGELKGACQELIELYGLKESVRMLGFQRNPYSFIKNARILCATSESEGYGLVLLEASMLGIPVLSSRTLGAEEVLGEHAQEICDTDEEFVVKIRQLLQNKKLYKEWQQSSEQRASAVITMDHYMQCISDTYELEMERD